MVVVATTKVGIFKQITTGLPLLSSASRCCCYHKGRNFQANHNCIHVGRGRIEVVVATTKVGIFKQITTDYRHYRYGTGCCCYHKGRNFQANHNTLFHPMLLPAVVVATTKVGIFKQITTRLRGSPRN